MFQAYNFAFEIFQLGFAFLVLLLNLVTLIAKHSCSKDPVSLKLKQNLRLSSHIFSSLNTLCLYTECIKILLLDHLCSKYHNSSMVLLLQKLQFHYFRYSSFNSALALHIQTLCQIFLTHSPHQFVLNCCKVASFRSTIEEKGLMMVSRQYFFENHKSVRCSVAYIAF